MAISGAVIPSGRQQVFSQSSLLPTPPQPYGHTLLRDKEEKRSEDGLRTGHKRTQEMHPQQLSHLLTSKLRPLAPSKCAAPIALCSAPGPETSAKTHQIPAALLPSPHRFCPALAAPARARAHCSVLRAAPSCGDRQGFRGWGRAGGTTVHAGRHLLGTKAAIVPLAAAFPM